jgi:hypothetical protein
VFVVATLVFANTIPNEYSHGAWRVTNDNSCFTQSNMKVTRGIDGIPKIWTSRYTQGQDISFGYRPVVETTFAIEYELFGQNPHISHLVNVMLYAILVCVLFHFLMSLFPSQSLLFPLFSCLLFAVHPIHVDAVAGLKNREEVVMMLFGFLAANFFIIYSKKRAKGLWLLIGGFVMIGLAVLSKANAAIFALLIPFSLVFKDWITLKQAVITGLLLAVICISTYFIPNIFLPPIERTFRFWEFPIYYTEDILIKLGAILNGLLFNLKMLIYPHEQGFYYGYNVVPLESIFKPLPILSLLIYVAILVAGILTFQKRSILSFGIWLFLLAMAPLSNLVLPLPGIVANRWLLLPSFALCIIVGWGLVQLKQIHSKTFLKPLQAKLMAIILVVVILITFSIKTIGRNEVWENYDTLYAHDIRHLENSAKAQSMVGHHFFRKAKIARGQKRKQLTNRALQHLKRAVEIYPSYKTVWNGLGTIYFKTKQYKKAIHAYRRCVDIDSSYKLAYGNLASAYHASNQFKQATKWYKKAIRKNPYDRSLYRNFSNLYLAMNKPSKAIQINQKLLEHFPNDSLAHKQIDSLKEKFNN